MTVKHVGFANQNEAPKVFAKVEPSSGFKDSTGPIANPKITPADQSEAARGQKPAAFADQSEVGKLAKPAIPSSGFSGSFVGGGEGPLVSSELTKTQYVALPPQRPSSIGGGEGPMVSGLSSQLPIVDSKTIQSSPVLKRFASALLASHRMKLYVPNNPGLYNAAISGFLAGVHQTMYLTDNVAADYASIVSEAAVFAEAVDLQIPAASPGTANEEFIFGISQAESAYRYTTSTPLAAYSVVAKAIAALYIASNTAFSPVAPPGGGITQLTGDVVAGPGTGSQAATLKAIDGIAVPSPTGTQSTLTYNAGVFTWANAVWEETLGVVSPVDGTSSVLIAGGLVSDESFAFNGSAYGLHSFSAGATVSGDYAVGLAGGIADGYQSTAIGNAAQSTVDHDVAIGVNAQAQGDGTNGALAFMGSAATHDLAIAGAGANVTGVGSVGFGSVIINQDGAYKFGSDAGTLLSLNADGFGTVELDAGGSEAFVFGNALTQTTVGSAGGASPLPALPLGYWVTSLVVGGGTQVVIPFYSLS